MGKTKAARKVWREKGFVMLKTRGLTDIQKGERSNVLRRVLGKLDEEEKD